MLSPLAPSHSLTSSIISDLEYCEEVEAMVTASRDSTVKVWEADWQIRMVFVGHTGVPPSGRSGSPSLSSWACPSPVLLASQELLLRL